MVITELSAFYL